MKHNVFEKNVRQSGMVRVRGGFSDTHGINRISTAMQLERFNDETRVQIGNQLFKLLELVMDNANRVLIGSTSAHEIANGFCKDLLNDVFCERNILKEGFRYDWRVIYNSKIENVIIHAEYNEVLDILEYICRWIDRKAVGNYKRFPYDAMNTVFEREYVGYRFIQGKIVSITDKQEIAAIEEACKEPYEGCRAHIQKAVGFLADRENKDYKNCIKESISAVEAICRIIDGDDKATLSSALNRLEKNGVSIHKDLKEGFISIYKYTCNKGGIRHAEKPDTSEVSFEEAKFMLVSCSAFVNYLIAVSGKGSN